MIDPNEESLWDVLTRLLGGVDGSKADRAVSQVPHARGSDVGRDVLGVPRGGCGDSATQAKAREGDGAEVDGRMVSRSVDVPSGRPVRVVLWDIRGAARREESR